MNNINVFCDADGVLTSFDEHVKLFSGGKTPNELGEQNLWTLIDSKPDFWITMPFFPWAKDLINFILPYSPTILTGCPKSNFDYAAEQKKLKFAHHFPGLPVITCLSRDKQLHMKNPGDFLIDDRHSNLKRWVKSGGKAIFFRTYEQTISDLKIALNIF